MLLAALLGAACGGPSVKSDWERKNEALLEKEDGGPLPAPPTFPRQENLVEFSVGAARDFRFFIDRTSLSVGDDRVVRYVLVARTADGVDNVSFEAMRCATSEYRVYALGRPDGSWAGRAREWRPIAARNVQHWHVALRREYFCPQNLPIQSADEGVRALEQGGHPFVKGFSGDALRGR